MHKFLIVAASALTLNIAPKPAELVTAIRQAFSL